MDLGLSNRTALVTAASKGLGKAVALELAREGARVTICARNRDRLKAAHDASLLWARRASASSPVAESKSTMKPFKLATTLRRPLGLKATVLHGPGFV